MTNTPSAKDSDGMRGGAIQSNSGGGDIRRDDYFLIDQGSRDPYVENGIAADLLHDPVGDAPCADRQASAEDRLRGRVSQHIVRDLRLEPGDPRRPTPSLP